MSPTDPPPFTGIMTHLGLAPDPWQADVLNSGHPRILLNCCRQAGKSTTVAILALVAALFKPMTKVLIVSRSHRQAKELIRQINTFHQALGDRLLERRSSEQITFTHLSRIVSVPCKEETIRGYSHIDIMILDEAARIPDDLYRAVRPMLAVSRGRLLCLSTPYGKRGFFWEAWAKGGHAPSPSVGEGRGGGDWLRVEIPASQCPRIPPAFLEEERRALGDSWFRQEYECSFEALEGLVYPDLHKCIVDELPPHVLCAVGALRVPSARDVVQTATDTTQHDNAAQTTPLSPHDGGRGAGGEGGTAQPRLLGGIDFGFRNPFAAVWGVLDRDNVLWLTGEHYVRNRPLSHHAAALPKTVHWYADPSGPAEIAELQCAGFTINPGKNAVRLGISAVQSRIEAGALKILKGRCPNLLAEAGLYRWASRSPLSPHDGGRGAGGEGGSENPVEESNHALDALRYLISRIDNRRLARDLKPDPKPEPPPPCDRYQEIMDNDRYWITLFDTHPLR